MKRQVGCSPCGTYYQGTKFILPESTFPPCKTLEDRNDECKSFSGPSDGFYDDILVLHEQWDG